MEAVTSRAARGVRALAVVAALLCCFIAVAPLIGRTTAVHHHHVHVVKIVSAASADQQFSTVRLDQPGVTLQHAGHSSDRSTTTTAAVSLTPSEDATVDSARTRGPPTTAI